MRCCAESARLKPPARLQPLIDEGFIDEVIRQLMSGKEAIVYSVRCGDVIRCAKVYKEAERRNFRQAALYQEGRKTKNTRDARAMKKGSRHGKRAEEEAWQSVEVDTLYQLAAAGVRVPKPHGFFQGVVLMDLLVDGQGNAAPRLNDVRFSKDQAHLAHDMLIREVVKMLCAGIIHGDLSEYNILFDESGPVIIDFPQAVAAAQNNNAAMMLKRDVENLKTYFAQFDDRIQATNYADEIWALYEKGKLVPDSPLTGHFVKDQRRADVRGIIDEISAVKLEHEARERQKAERD